MTKPTMWHVHPAETQISLGIRPVCSESSLCAQWVAEDPSFFHADWDDSDQTGWMPRLIWVFAGRTNHFVGFVMRRLIFPVLMLCLYLINMFDGPVIEGFNSLYKSLAGPVLAIPTVWLQHYSGCVDVPQNITFLVEVLEACISWKPDGSTWYLAWWWIPVWNV